MNGAERDYKNCFFFIILANKGCFSIFCIYLYKWIQVFACVGAQEKKFFSNNLILLPKPI